MYHFLIPLTPFPVSPKGEKLFDSFPLGKGWEGGKVILSILKISLKSNFFNQRSNGK
jgi:hypothetical protein